jgi:hypothetical protein
MLRNIGTGEQFLRVFVGVAAISLAYVGPQTAWGYLGIIPLVTGVVGYCPLYALFGWSTNRRPAIKR